MTCFRFCHSIMS